MSDYQYKDNIIFCNNVGKMLQKQEDLFLERHNYMVRTFGYGTWLLHSNVKKIDNLELSDFFYLPLVNSGNIVGPNYIAESLKMAKRGLICVGSITENPYIGFLSYGTIGSYMLCGIEASNKKE